MRLEVVDNLAGGFGADPFDETRTEVFFQCGAGRRALFDGPGRIELPAVLGVDSPGAKKRHGRTGKHLGLMNDDGLLPVGRIDGSHAQDRPAGVGVVEGDPVNDSPQPFGYRTGRQGRRRQRGTVGTHGHLTAFRPNLATVSRLLADPVRQPNLRRRQRVRDVAFNVDDRRSVAGVDRIDVDRAGVD